MALHCSESRWPNSQKVAIWYDLGAMKSPNTWEWVAIYFQGEFFPPLNHQPTNRHLDQGRMD